VSSAVEPEGAASIGPRRVVLLLFFGTGVASLIYQVIWLRLLATVFGSTTYATATVLAAFMGGLALGSYAFGRWADRLSRPLVVYGLLEIGVGLFALVFPLILRGYEQLHADLQRITSWSFYAYSLVRFVACAAMLVIPTTLMGGTFPIMSRFYVRRFSRFTADVGLLYGINTAGAVVGVVAAGFFLIVSIGIFRTSVVAASVNLIAGLAAIVLGRAPMPAAAPEADADADEPAGPAGADRGYLRTLLTAAFLSGLAGLAYEVIWTRTLVFVLDSFVYSFSIMLATFLTGLAVGSLVLSALAGRLRREHTALAVIFVLIGFSTVATFPFFARLTDWKLAYLGSFTGKVGFEEEAPWLQYILFKFGISSLIIVVPTLLMGAAFPLLLRLYTTSIDRMGGKIGAVYAANTVGAIVGSFLAGFVLIPFLGSQNALVTTSAVSVATGCVLFALPPGAAWRRRVLAAALPAAAFVVTAWALPSDVYQRVFQKAQGSFDLVYYKEDPTATITAHRRGQNVLIALNGLNVAGTGFNFLTTQKMQAHLALLLHPDPRTVMQIGFGSGGTAYSVSRHASVERIDCVELCQGVIDAAGLFLPSNHGVLKDPRVHLTIDDARNYVRITPRRYDIILSDSIHPTYAGNGTLYSKDYFAACRKKLNPGGFVSFWMPTYLLSTDDYKSIIRTFQSEFPYVMVWYVNNAIEAYTIVIGKTEPIEVDVQRIRDKLSQPAVAGDLAQIEVLDEFDIISYFVMGPETVAQFVDGAELNTDDHPVIEFRAPRSMSRRRTWYHNLQSLAEMREPPLRYLRHVAHDQDSADAFSARLRDLYKAVSVMLQGQLIDIVTWDFERELAVYRRAKQLCPESRAVRRLEALTLSRVLVVRSEKLEHEGHGIEALATLHRAIDVSPDVSDDFMGQAWYRTATLLRAQGDLYAAMIAASGAVDVLPRHAEARALYDTLRRELGYPDYRVGTADLSHAGVQ